ncbi:hypothetical protein JRQ81_015368 [Phrynocephalus forsythii]|uniref:Uncharacterized protein n=1 Tax=Phrynocephalus forsythii TaxID=171643 RepID=A0A9Q1B233_9SAUR|nr:hypothetical protein JRQ81_015368 [Phrynocephalus forsythii]
MAEQSRVWMLRKDLLNKKRMESLQFLTAGEMSLLNRKETCVRDNGKGSALRRCSPASAVTDGYGRRRAKERGRIIVCLITGGRASVVLVR